MRVGTAFINVIFVLGALTGPTSTPAREKPPKTSDWNKLLTVPHVPGELLIKLRDGSAKLPFGPLDAAGVRLEGPVSTDPLLVRATVAGDLVTTATTLADDPGVEYVEPNYLVRTQAIPNDPKYGEQWGLESAVYEGDIRATEAWDITTGSREVVVAVIDSGIDLTHPDLVENIVPGFDALDHDGKPQDENGHGTHVSGILGARGNNNKGVTGVCWNVSIMPLRFIKDEEGTTADAIACFDEAVAARRRGVNVRVINASWGGYGYSRSLEDAVVRAGNAGILVVCAAGNDNRSNDEIPLFPASFGAANVVSVGAIRSDGVAASFSNFGQHTVDVFAPGMGILSTLPGGRYGYKSGTSMSAPFVSGLAALVLAVHRDSSIAQLKSRVLGSATFENIQHLRYLCLAGGFVTGPAILHSDLTPPAVPSDFRVTGSNASGVSVTWSAVGDDGFSRSATYYDLRWATGPITSENFETATQLDDALVPRTPGSAEYASVAGCSAGSPSRYLALRVYDAAGNFSQSPTIGGPTIDGPSDYQTVAWWREPTFGGSGVALGDDVVARIELPFDFPFYGVPYRVMYVSTNGIITFDGPAGHAYRDRNDLAGRAAIAPLWTDLVTIVGIENGPLGLEISWGGRLYEDYVEHPNLSDKPVHFAVRLHADGEIDFIYDESVNARLAQGSKLPIVGISDGGCNLRLVEGYDGRSSLAATPSIGLRPNHDDQYPSARIHCELPASVMEGEEVHARMYATDQTGVTVSARFVISSLDLYFDLQHGQWEYYPDSVASGTHSALVTAYDAYGHAITQVFSVEVLDNPALPEIHAARVGKNKISVTGIRFAAGSQLIVDGHPTTDTVAAPGSPSTKLSTKSGRGFYTGPNTFVWVVGPDGKASNGFALGPL